MGLVLYANITKVVVIVHCCKKFAIGRSLEGSEIFVKEVIAIMQTFHFEIVAFNRISPYAALALELLIC